MDSQPPRDATGSIETIRSSKKTIALMLLGSFGFTVGFALMVGFGDLEKAFWGWVGGSFFGLCSLAFLLMLLRGAPQIVLSPDGIRQVGAFKDIHWNWADVGPFAASEQVVNRHSIFYVCAYTDRHHDLMAARGETTVASHVDGDIKIGLGTMPAGRSFETAEAFADHLNSWRDRFGRPEVEVDVHTADRTYLDFERKRKRRQFLHWVGIGLAVVISVFFVLSNFILGV